MRDIETRPDSRRQGFAQEIREAMEKETGRPIYSSGSYTPEGWEAFGKHGGRYAESEVGGYGNEPGVKFDSMGFVASWKHQIPLNDDRRITYDREQRDAMYELSDKGVFKKFREGELIWAEE